MNIITFLHSGQSKTFVSIADHVYRYYVFNLEGMLLTVDLDLYVFIGAE